MQVGKEQFSTDRIEMIRRMLGSYSGNVRTVRTNVGEIPVSFPEKKDGKERKAFAVKSVTYNKRGKFQEEWVALTEEEATMLHLEWNDGRDILDELS